MPQNVILIKVLRPLGFLAQDRVNSSGSTGLPFVLLLAGMTKTRSKGIIVSVAWV